MRSRSLAFALGLLTSIAVFFVNREARADRELIVPFHEAGHLVLDQLSGFRANPASGVSYAGPLGIMFRTEKADAFAPGAASSELSTTTFWVAPSVDVFVTDHLSVGGFVEVSHTSGTATSGDQKLELPGTTSMTFLPRVGFYAPLSDRLGIWPRAGFGWTSAESVSYVATGGQAVRDTFRSAILDVDLALVYRFTETFFCKVGPEVGVTLGARRGEEVGNSNAAAGASVVQISGVVGFGANFEL